MGISPLGFAHGASGACGGVCAGVVVKMTGILNFGRDEIG